MPTPAEQKALAVLSLVVLLGGAVRVVRAGALGTPPASAAEQQGLARQATAASSLAVADRDKGRAKALKNPRSAPKRRYGGAKFDSTGLLIDGTGVVNPFGFPPPSPRIDVDMRHGRGAQPSRAEDANANHSIGPLAPVDLDVADVAGIERLPWIGPALARRIVANRDSLGPYGGLAALRRVKGVGPATLERIARLVTFSGQARR
jgi:DNA uptake protein ComE-like DNA-binding protein